MIDGLDDIRHAAETLAKQDERLKARLKQAGAEFWSAMYHSDGWPPELKKRAEKIQREILAHGSVNATVSRMSIDEAKEVAGKLLDLLVAFERASAAVETDAADEAG